MKQNRPLYKVKPNISFKNNITKEITVGDIVNEEDIEGKRFYIVKIGPRYLKFSKEGYSIVKSANWYILRLGDCMKKTTKLKGKYIEDYTVEDIENLSREELRIFYGLLTFYLLDQIDDYVNNDSDLKEAKQFLSKFTNKLT